jgi:myo-inositol-1(or 4)-monophosphatase
LTDTYRKPHDVEYRAGGAVLVREAGLVVRIGHDPVSDAYWIAAGTGALIAATERLWSIISRAT